MARPDVQYAHDPALSTSRRRLRASNAGSQWVYDLDRSSFPSSDLSEHSHSPPELKGRSSVSESTPTEQPWTLYDPHTSSDGPDHRSQRSRSAKPKVHIKPMLRRMSRDDAPSTSIDLSRSSTEQDGLGIYLNLDRDRRQSESLTGSTFRRAGLHHRSASGTSQFSTATASSITKPGSQYIHPMRQVPSAYTPPLGQSYQTSANESELDDENTKVEPAAFPGSETHHATPRVSSSGPAAPRLSLHIQDDSFTRLPGISQTNVASRPSFGYSRDAGSTVDTASPSSRTSLDFAFRSRTRTSTDPMSRAATVQAARQAFEEKEAAKARRFEKQQIKAEERQTRRREKRSRSNGRETPAANNLKKEMSEKPDPLGGSSRTSDTGLPPEKQQPTSWKSQSKSTWMLFVTWLRTRVFKLRRKLGRLR